jgi:hypothetical protein
MIKIIIYSIITIAIIHFILYYFNFDFNLDTIKMFYSNHSNIRTNENSNYNFETTNGTLYDSINELKTLNECINNGEIDTSFS